MPCLERLNWDSRVLGMECARLHAVDGRQNLDAFHFCYAREDLRGIPTIQRLEDEGFRVVDVMNVYQITGMDAGVNDEYSVMGGVEDLSNQIYTLADLRQARMHRDPEVGEGLAIHFYRELVKSLLADGTLITARDSSNNMVGFLLSKNHVLWLIGVDPEHRGKGVGSMLLKYFITQWGCIEVGTQVDNLAANRLYTSKTKYKVVSNLVTLHWWAL